MRFTYYYKKADGIRREGEIESPTRDEAFAALRQNGIRPIKMFAADGSKANGEVRMGWKRWAVIAALALALMASLAYIHHLTTVSAVSSSASVLSSTSVKAAAGQLVAKPRPRKWIERENEFLYEQIFEHPAEAFLAKFAEPGFLPNGVMPQLTDAVREDFYDSLADDIPLVRGEPVEIASLKRIVAGMKQEAEMSIGGGMSVDDFVTRLQERQRMEIAYRAEIMSGAGTAQEKAEKLHKIGFKTGGKNN